MSSSKSSRSICRQVCQGETTQAFVAQWKVRLRLQTSNAALPVELGIESESLWKQFIKEEKLHPKTKEEMEDVRMTMIRGREDL